MNLDFATIITKKLPCFFISPHLDDAALSCGGLITDLASKTDISIVTIFTKAHNGPYTLSAKQALKFSRHTSAELLYEERRNEDLQAFNTLPVTIVHAGETEALYRRKKHNSYLSQRLGSFLPELTHEYPTYRFHISQGYMGASEGALIKRIGNLIASFPAHAVVFAPLGIGNHSDHRLIHNAVTSVTKPVLWIDQPYFIREQQQNPNTKLPEGFHEYKYEKKAKIDLVKKYKSQISLLFPSAELPVLPEYYSFPKQ